MLMGFWLDCTTLVVIALLVVCSLWEYLQANDLMLLAPSPSAMRKLLRICDESACEYSIVG